MTNVVWQTLKDYCFRFRLFLVRPYRRQIRQTKRQAQNLRDELYQKHLIEEMRKSYHRDIESAMLLALDKYKRQKELQKAFRDALEAETTFKEKPVLQKDDKETSNSFKK